MAGPLNATVILSRCSKSKKLFGIRVEQRGRDWVRTWAFKIDERKAKNEGFESNQVTLSGSGDGYPGCPHCSSLELVQCDCGKMGCGDGSDYYVCPWCGEGLEVSFVDSVDVRGGGY